MCICFIGCIGKNHIVLNFSINKPQEFNLFGWNIKIYPNINNWESSTPLYDYGITWHNDFNYGTVYWQLEKCEKGNSFLLVASSSKDDIDYGPYYGIFSDDLTVVLQSTGEFLLNDQVMSDSQ
jgi:hypothetical protein